MCGAAVAALVACGVAAAPGAARARDWTGQVTLYGWGAGVSGNFTPFAGGPALSFGSSRSGVLEDLDGAVFITGPARRGGLVLPGDLTCSASSRSGRLPPGIPASGKVTIRALTLAAGRSFDSGSATVDALGGLRAWNIDGEVTSPVLNLLPSRSASMPRSRRAGR